MTVDVSGLVASRAAVVSRSLVRHRLVFLQIGSAFEPLRQSLIAQLGHPILTPSDALNGLFPPADAAAILIVGVEGIASTDWSGPSLGALREEVLARVEKDQCVCLVSRAPRCAFGSVPGSSLLEDCALVTVPLLSSAEVPGHRPHWSSSWKIPVVSIGDGTFSEEILLPILLELGNGVLESLDHVLFEIDPKSSAGIRFMLSRELEALRGAGLVEADGANVELVVNDQLELVKETLAGILSEITHPPHELGHVSSGLWLIERSIRAALRRAAIIKWGKAWRGSGVGGNGAEVLKRARLDSSIAATSLAELRDPFEWLTLGELLGLVRSPQYGNLGRDAVLWRRLQDQLVPIRNRLAHVRMLKTADEEIVATWLAVIKRELR